MKKGTKYAVLAGVAVVVGFVSFFLIKSNKFTTGQSAAWALVPVLIVLAIGIPTIEKKHKEHYSEEMSGDGCNQTINIYQNCPGPSPPGPDGPVKKLDVLAWIKSVDSQLSGGCQDCIANTAVKMWKQSDLAKVKSMAIDRQKVVLNAMLVIDCNSQCIIPPSGLDRKEVAQWVSMIGPELSAQCQECAVNAIMKLWSPNDFAKARIGMKQDQARILQGLIVFNCKDCDINKLNPADVQKWLSTILTGAKPDCYKCAVDSIVNLWDVTKFNQVKQMDKKSQTQVVQALIALNCEKECVEVPSGLTPQQAMSWLNTVLVGENPNCTNCLVSAIVKNWSPAILDVVKSKPKADQEKILQALLAMNCQSICHPSPHPENLVMQINAWLRKLLPSLSADCLDCIVKAAASMWDEQQFAELQTKSCDEQVKIVRLIGDFNCAGTCTIPPLSPCN
jgi:hypothetical protein